MANAIAQPQFVCLKDIEINSSSDLRSIDPYQRTHLPDDWIYPNEMLESRHAFPPRDSNSLLNWTDDEEEEMFALPAVIPPLRPRQIFERELMPPPPPGPIRRARTHGFAPTGTASKSFLGKRSSPPPVKRQPLGERALRNGKAPMSERQQMALAMQMSLEAAGQNDQFSGKRSDEEDDDDDYFAPPARRRSRPLPSLSASPPPLPAASKKRKATKELDEDESASRPSSKRPRMPSPPSDDDDDNDFEVKPIAKRRRKEAKPAPKSQKKPRATGDRRPKPPGPPPDAVYGPGTQPIPARIQNVVQQIKDIAANGSHPRGLPQRVRLRSMPSGVKDLERRYGYLENKPDCLYQWYGDTRLFNREWWEHLVKTGN